MAIDYDAVERAGGIGKGAPLRTLLHDAKRKWQKVDERNSEKVRKRSEGRCEVRVKGVRCRRAAVGEPHHHMGGYGVRGRGESALPKHKTHTCRECHRRIHAKLLIHISGNRYRERG